MAIKAGHVYQDGEGCLMIALQDAERAQDAHFWVFANNRPVRGDTPLVVHPLTLVFDDKGKNTGADLRYPHGSAFRQKD